MNIGAAVREARKAVGLTQAELGLQTGLSRRAVILLETGGGRVTTLEAVAAALAMRLTGLPTGATIGDQVRQARAKHKLTQAQLADAASLSIPTIREIESGGGLVSSLSAVLAVLAPTARRRKHPRASWGNAGDERYTPPQWLDAIETAFGPISIDPCYHPRSFVRAERTIDAAQNGLTTAWSGQLAFVNPPFSANSEWIHRCANAWQQHEVETVIALLPARTETAAFHDRVAGNAHIILLRGKPRFFNASRQQMSIAPFAAMFVVWGSNAEAVLKFAEIIGGTVIQPDQVTSSGYKTRGQKLTSPGCHAHQKPAAAL